MYIDKDKDHFKHGINLWTGEPNKPVFYTTEMAKRVREIPKPMMLLMDIAGYPEFLAIRLYEDNFAKYDGSIKMQVIEYVELVKKTLESLQGTYGLIIQSIFEPDTLYCVRNGSPLLVGQNEEEVIVTSEQSGFCGRMSNYITLHNDDICIITKCAYNIEVNTVYNYTKKDFTFNTNAV